MMTSVTYESTEELRLPVEGISIAAFRGLRNVELSNFGRINLLVGAGNSGKTSVLEALALYASPLNLQSWLAVVRAREVIGLSIFDRSSPAESLRWLFPHTGDGGGLEGDTHDPIKMNGWGAIQVTHTIASCQYVRGMRSVTFENEIDEEGEMVTSHEETFVEDEGWKFDLLCSLKGEPSDGVYSQTYWNRTGTEIGSRSNVGVPSAFLPPYAHRNQPMQVSGLSKAVEDDQKRVVEDLLRDLDHNILGLEIISDRRGTRPLIALRHRKAGLAPINVFGDGVRRALMIALAIQQNRGGIILVDEIEAALHVSALNKIFPWIERACKKYGVQLFATTHSLEAIDAIVACSFTENIAAYQIESGDNNTSVKRFSKGMLQRVVHDRGLDIR